ncbi:hypothetical protein [Paenibacillus sp. SN-8-1]|uniref:hypothetical protein n=1 Tax=Paenibacillus sp. SN-8-1 TaxID=3435409 RepID=UPI003D9A7A65
MMEKYIGEIVEIIYLDAAGKITQRKIEVHGIRNGLVRSKCLQSGQPRAFKLDNILAIQPVQGGVRRAV